MTKLIVMRLVSLFAIALAATCSAQNDEGYTKQIRDFTTEKFFLTEFVDHLPASKTVPSPDKVLGHIIGAPNTLDYVDQINGYMRTLEKASPRVKVVSMGKSEEGREMICAVISDEKNLARLDQIKQDNALLSDPRKTTDLQAEKLISDTLPIYWATGGMHAPESGPPEMLMELAYRLAVEETPYIQEIRKNSIVMLTPVLDADGRDRYVDTYLYRKKNPQAPPIPLVYWGKYVAHDCNRDGMALSLALSRGIMNTWFDFHPLVFHDLHESVPFLYISTGTGPYNAWLDPITIDEWHILAYDEVDAMTKRGVPGVWTHGYFDGWAPNYGFYAANGHNAIGRFYETFGGPGADTGVRNVGQQSNRDWYRPNPPLPRVRWSIRDNTNIMQSALIMGMHHIAMDKDTFLHNFWLKSKRSVAKARTEGPAAWVIPAGEQRVGQQRELLKMLARQGIEIQQLDEQVTTAEGKFGKDSFVVRMDQPYSRMADTMLDKQFYSNTDPRPYDDTGWTLGPLFNLKTVRVKDTKILDAKMTVVDKTGLDEIRPRVSGAAEDNAPFYVLKPSGDLSWVQLRFQTTSNVGLDISEKTFKVGDQEYPVGSLIIEKSNVDKARSLGLRPIALTAKPDVKTHPLEAPRIAIVHTWSNTQDDGWYRVAFDSIGVPYKYIPVQKLRDTAVLSNYYDVIIIPQTGGSAQSIVNGMPNVGQPIPWKPMGDFKALGGPDEIDNIKGGIELQGMVNLQKFVNEGGLLICTGTTCTIPIQYGMVNGITTVDAKELVAPGSVLLANNPSSDNLVTAGFDPTLGVYFSDGPLFQAGFGGFRGGRGGGAGAPTRASGRGDAHDPDVIQGRPPYTAERKEGDAPDPVQQPTAPQPKVLLSFADANSLLISGALDHGEELAGRPALVLCPVGKGNVLLFSINPMWRQETHGSWPLIFNAAMNFRNLH